MSHAADSILHLRGWVALVVIFAVPALESSVFLGFIFPGEIAVLLGGVLAYQHRVSLAAAIAAAVAGAIIGDTIGYEVGKHVGRRVLEGSIGRVVKHEHLDRAERYLAEKGGKAVFLGRFTAALRVLIPGMAGMSNMHYPTFAAFNVAGGTIWAAGFVLLGYAAGSSYRQVESVAKKASLLLLLIIVVIALAVLAARQVARHRDAIRALAARQAERRVPAFIRSRYRRQLDFLLRRFRLEETVGFSLTMSLVLIALAGWAFGVLVQDVLTDASLNPLDRPVLRFFVARREPWLTTANQVVTAFGSSGVLIPVVVIVGLVWWWRGKTVRPLALLGGAYLGAEVLFRLIKILVGRPRPPMGQAVAHFSGLAFPSGHATISAAVWGMIAALAAAALSRWTGKVAVWTAAVLLIAAIGATRLYLGAHWLTDVLGGWALGALWLTALLTTVKTIGAMRAGPSPAPDDLGGSPTATDAAGVVRTAGP